MVIVNIRRFMNSSYIHFSEPGMSCPANAEYSVHSKKCQPSCVVPNPQCTDQIEGCVCRKGYILSGNKCVRKSECGCFHNGLYMEVSINQFIQVPSM